jgi:hypothetical protein
VFHPGGGGHITLAATGGHGYSSWIDRDGDRRGQVDVTPLVAAGAGTPQIAASFHLPAGGIHGATACAGKVFFAPSAGVNWVRAVENTSASGDAFTVHSLSLGDAKDGTPRRTGAFTATERHVLCTTGAGPEAELTLIDAAESEPRITRLNLGFSGTARPSGLEVLAPRRGKTLAVVFEERPDAAGDQLVFVDLDPNGDRDYADAQVLGRSDIGRAKVQGHAGHHGLTLDGDRRRAIVSNPGDGTIALVSLGDRTVLMPLSVGGAPSKLVAVGGRGGSH